MRVKLDFEWRRPGEDITNVDLRTATPSVNDVAERGSTIAALVVE